MRKIILLVFLFAVNYQNAYSQQLGEWEVYPSLSTVNGLTMDDTHFYTATSGGIFIVDRNESEISEIITTLEGLYRADPISIIHDPGTDKIFTGYVDGTIDVIDAESFSIERLEDIARVSRFSSKSVNDFIIYNDELYVATNFGIIIYDLQSLLVNNSYTKLGELNTGIPINGLDIVSNTIYVATSQGIAIGDLNLNLVESNNWSVIDEEDGLPTNLMDDIQVFNGTMFALGEGNLYSFKNDVWVEEDISSNSIRAINKSEDQNHLGIISGKEIIRLDEQGQISRQQLDIESSITKVLLDGDLFAVGTETEGLITSEIQSDEQIVYLPSGPYLNFFNDLFIDRDFLAATSTQEFPGPDPFNRIRGYYLFDGESWQNYNRNTTQALSNAEMVYTVTSNDSAYYFGSWGSGVVRHNKTDNEIRVFNRGNSNLTGLKSGPNFIVIGGIEADMEGNIWATSFNSDFPLTLQLNGSDEWLNFDSESGNDSYFNLFIDSFDQKWISLISENNNGLGLLVLNTGNPENPDDDVSVKLTDNPLNGNLPNEKITAIIQDKNEEVWIGTERGIARFIFPELIIDGGSNERQAQWLINEDTTASSRFLLRDVNVSAMAVNDANQKWIGSRTQGLWLLNEEGNRIEKRFTTDNSDLISNNIQSIAIDRETGQVFVATDLGLVSFMDIPQQPVSKMDELKVYPNPFSYSRHNQIVIEGLSDATQIKVLGVDGMVMNEISAQGGRVSWDGHDYNGNKLGTGVYFIVAYENDGGQRGIGKVVIAR